MSQPGTSPLTIAIFGAGGATGQQAIRAAREKGYGVRAIDRSEPETKENDPGVTHITGDVLRDDLREHVAGGDAVLSCLGVGNDPQTLLDPPPLYTDGTQAICDAMTAESIKRLVVISASFVEEKNRGPIWFKLPAMTALHLVFEQMKKMEGILATCSAIDWTAVRPGWLMEGDPTDDYIVQEDVIAEDTIRTRHADLAHFMVTLAAGTDWVHRTPAISRSEPPSASSPLAVAGEMIR